MVKNTPREQIELHECTGKWKWTSDHPFCNKVECTRCGKVLKAKSGLAIARHDLNCKGPVPEKKMAAEHIKKLVLQQGLTITDLIDVVVEINGIIGVGLIRLGDDLNHYCRNIKR